MLEAGIVAVALAVVLNEVAYDPDGPDAGAEYVELLNVDRSPVTLDARWRLERGNGARPDDWTVFWTGDGRSLAPGERLVVGDHPAAGVEATPSLQNGPDAVRLVGPDGTDVVGWGVHELAGYVEGAPVADRSPGHIARRPDGVDTDDNAADWWPGARPTPGAVNFPPVGLLARPGWPALAPPLPDVGRPCSLVVEVTSVGLGAVPAGTAGVLEHTTGARRPLAEPLSPGGERTVKLPLPGLPAGAVVLRLGTFGAGVLDEVEVRVRVGSGAVLLHEILARPGGDAPEWVELVTHASPGDRAGGEGVAWRIEDRTGGSAAFIPPDRGPGDPWVVTDDPGALLAAYPELDPARVVVADGWASLNDGDERLLVVDPDGGIHDAVTYVDAVTGVSLERVSPEVPSSDPAAWVPAPLGPTPGAPNGARGTLPTRATLEVIPPVVGPGGAEVDVHLGDGPGFLELRVVDPRGRVRGVLLERDGAGRAVLRLASTLPDGTRLPPGLYVLVARFHPATGGVRARRTSFAGGWEGAR